MARTLAVFIAGTLVLVAVAAMATTRKSSTIFFDAPATPAASMESRAG